MRKITKEDYLNGKIDNLVIGLEHLSLTDEEKEVIDNLNRDKPEDLGFNKEVNYTIPEEILLSDNPIKALKKLNKSKSRKRKKQTVKWVNTSIKEIKGVVKLANNITENMFSIMPNKTMTHEDIGKLKFLTNKPNTE